MWRGCAIDAVSVWVWPQVMATGRTLRMLFRVRMTRAITAAAFASALASTTVSLAKSNIHAQRHAPAVSTLPRISGSHVIASAAGGSDVDSASNRKRYRYLAISKPSRISARQLLVDQVHFLREAGWRHLYVFHCVSRPKSPAGAVCRRTSLNTPGASALLDAPNEREYVALDAVKSKTEAARHEDGTPLWGNRAIRTALQRRQPVLFGSLGNGRHA